jgi:hypothetical protein
MSWLRFEPAPLRQVGALTTYLRLTLPLVTVPTGCQSFHLGKAVVFQSSFRGMPVYVKSKSIDKRVVDGHTISFHADLDPRFALLLKLHRS